MTVTTASTVPTAPQTTSSRWAGVADEVAARLAADVVAREAAGRAPHAEVQLLRDHDLLALLVPAAAGGHGEPWATAFDVVSRVARVDPSIAHVLGYHYLHSWRTRLGRRADVVARLDAGTAEHRWLWGGAGNPRDAGLQLRPVDGGYLVRGRKFFATGAEVSDRVLATGTVVDAQLPDPSAAQAPRKLAFAVRTDTVGITHGGDWTAMGQRVSASGSITFEDALVPEEDVLGPGEQTDPSAPAYPSLSVLGFQAMLALLQVSIAEGALAAGSRYTATTSRPWATSGVDRAVDDPLVRARYGELASEAMAARALTDAAAAAWSAATERGWQLTHDERGEVAVRLSAAKVVTTRVALDVTATVFELTGARATSAGTGLDRYWRDARTLTLHDPVSYKALEVGDHLLIGAYPTPSQYA